MQNKKNAPVKIQTKGKDLEIQYRPVNEYKSYDFFIKKEILESFEKDFKMSKKKKYLLVEEMLSTALDAVKEDGSLFTLDLNDIAINKISKDKNYHRARIYIRQEITDRYIDVFSCGMKSTYINKLLEIGYNEIVN